jgi:hypothetical protein
MEAMLLQVADAINDAPDGYILAESEEKVRDLVAEIRQQAFGNIVLLDSATSARLITIGAV